MSKVTTHTPDCAQLEKRECPANKSLFGELSTAHWWSGYPGAICLKCGDEDKDEVCIGCSCECHCHDEFWKSYESDMERIEELEQENQRPPRGPTKQALAAARRWLKANRATLPDEVRATPSYALTAYERAQAQRIAAGASGGSTPRNTSRLTAEEHEDLRTWATTATAKERRVREGELGLSSGYLTHLANRGRK